MILRALIFVVVITSHVNACIFNDTACTCALRSSEATCLKPLETNSSLCKSYPCSNNYACDCSGSYLCSIAECSESQKSYLPITTLSSSNVTSCVVSEVSICATVIDEIEDSTEDSEISYNYTIVASGDFTVYSGGESLYSVAVRAPRRGGRKEITGCDALIIELMYSYDPEVEQGLSFAIQQTDSSAVYVSGDPDLIVRMAFNPSGDYRASDSYDFSSWVSPTKRDNLRLIGSFGDADDEFGAHPLGFDSTNNTSVNTDSGTYVYYIELPFCDNPKSLGSRPGRHDKQEPSTEGHGKPMMSPEGELGEGYEYITNGSAPKIPGIPPGFEDVTVIGKSDVWLSDEELAEVGLDLKGIQKEKIKYSIVGSGNFVVYALGKQARNASMMTVIQGEVDIPCVPIPVEMEFDADSNNSAPSISVVLEMEADNGKKTYVSGSNLKIAVVHPPPDGHLKSKDDYNFSILAPAVVLLKLGEKMGFSLLRELYGAEPVGFSNIHLSNTSYMYPQDHTNSTTMNNGQGMDDNTAMSGMGVRQEEEYISNEQDMVQVLLPNTSVGNMTMGKSPFASNNTYMFVIFPPCTNLFSFDDAGHVHEIPMNMLESFSYGMDMNETYGEPGKPVENGTDNSMTATESKSDVFGNVEFVYSEGEIDTDKLVSDGYHLTQMPVSEITFLLTASDSYKVTMLGQQVENGSLHNILFGTAELPCTPIIVETQFSPNQSAVSLPGLSLAIVGESASPNSVVNVTTGGNSLPILVAVNPSPGYDKLNADYNFTDFKPAVPAPSISNVSGFGVMKDLAGAIPVGPFPNNSHMMAANFTKYPYNITEMNMTLTPVKIVYIVRIPTCLKVYKFGNNGAPEDDDALNEMFGENSDMLAEKVTPTKTWNPEGSKMRNKLEIDIEAVVDNFTKYEGVVVEDRYSLNESLHAALGHLLEEVPFKEAQIAIVGSNNFSLFVLGRQVIEVANSTILPGFVDLPCTPLIVEMNFKNDSDIKSPFISAALSTVNDSALYASGGNLHIDVAFNLSADNIQSNSGFLMPNLVPATPLLSRTTIGAFGLFYDMFDAVAVGFARNMIDGDGILADLTSLPPFSDKQDEMDQVEVGEMNGNNGTSTTPTVSANYTSAGMMNENTAADNGTIWKAPSGKYVFIIYPPCSSLYSIEKDGKLANEKLSGNSLNSSLAVGETKPESSLDDGMNTEEFFHSNDSNYTESAPFAYTDFDIYKIEEDLKALGLDLDDLPVSEFRLEMTSTEDFEVFAVGKTIESGYKGQVLRGEAYLPCTPILILSKFMPNESVVMPAISVAITHVVPNYEVTFVSGNRKANESLDIWVDLTVDGVVDGSQAGYNFSSLERAISVPSLRNLSSFRYLENMYGATPVGPRLITDMVNIGSTSGNMNVSSPAEIPQSSSSSETVPIFVVFVIQPPMCESLFKFDENGMTAVDELFQDMDEDLPHGMFNESNGINETIEEPGTMVADMSFDNGNISGSSDGVGSSNTTPATEEEDNGGMTDTSDGGFENGDIELKRTGDFVIGDKTGLFTRPEELHV